MEARAGIERERWGGAGPRPPLARRAPCPDITMKIGTIVAFLLVAGYLAVEFTAMVRARPRMEPDAIYGTMIEARTAVERCGDPSAEQVAGFEAELERMRGRVRTKFSDAPAAPDSTSVEASIAALTRRVRHETEAMIDAEGCDSFAARRLLQRHRMHAR